MRPVSVVLLLAATGACTASPPGSLDSGVTPWTDAAREAVADAAPPGPDARAVDCPPGLPDSFDAAGNTTSTNATYYDPDDGGPQAQYLEHYNVFSDLDGDPRWFFAMNLYDGRDVFEAGVAPGKYAIDGEDTDVQFCSLCVNLFADQDEVEGGPSLHLFAQKGTLIIDAVDGDDVSGHLEDVLLGAIEIVYDDEGIACSENPDGTIDHVAACENSICLSGHCGRQVGLVGCSTSIQRLDF